MSELEAVQTFFELCPDLLCTIQNGYILWANQTWQRVVGWSLAELRSRPWLEFIHPEDRELNLQTYAQARFQCQDNSYVYLDWRMTQNIDGCIYATARVNETAQNDQFETYRKNTEAKLEESYSLLEAMAEGISEHLFAKDTKGRYLLINSSALRAFDLVPEQVIGKTDIEIFPSDYARDVMASDRQIIASGKAQILEEVLEIGDITHTFLSSKSVYRDTEGKVIGIMGLSWDITERKRSEEVLRRSRDELEKIVQERTAELARSERRLQAILDNSTAIIFLKDLQGRYIMVNRMFEKLFNTTFENVKNKTAHEIFPKEIADTYAANSQQVISSGMPITIEETVLIAGSAFTYIAVLFPLFDDDGIPNSICGISTDITALKQAEMETHRALEKERELAKLRSQFIVPAR